MWLIFWQSRRPRPPPPPPSKLWIIQSALPLSRDSIAIKQQFGKRAKGTKNTDVCNADTLFSLGQNKLSCIQERKPM